MPLQPYRTMADVQRIAKLVARDERAGDVLNQIASYEAAMLAADDLVEIEDTSRRLTAQDALYDMVQEYGPETVRCWLEHVVRLRAEACR